MSEIENFEVKVREHLGKGGARATRRSGRVPGTLYGGGEPPISIDLDANRVKKTYVAGGFQSKLAKLTHDGKEQLVIARDVQVHPVKDTPLHVDLMRVDEKTLLNLEIQVRFLNEDESPGIKRGGVLNVVRHTVELRCPATRIPDHLEADLTGLDINDSLHISAIALPEGVTPTITDRDFTIATIAAPSAAVEADDEAGEGIEAGEVPTVGEEEETAAKEEGDEA